MFRNLHFFLANLEAKNWTAINSKILFTKKRRFESESNSSEGDVARKISISRVSEMPGSVRCHVYLFLTTMAHTLDSVLGSKGLRLTVITTFSESFASWCRLKKELDSRRGLSWMTSMESRVSSAAFCKIFTAAKRILVPFARQRLSRRE